MTTFELLGGILGLIVAGVVIDQIACRLEKAGHLRWRNAKPWSGAAAGLSEFQSFLQPDRPTIEMHERAAKLAEDDCEHGDDDGGEDSRMAQQHRSHDV